MPLTDWILIDVESTGREDARQWVTPASNLVDPKKIAASIEERTEKLALDPNGARIVCVGWDLPDHDQPTVLICPTPDHEREVIRTLWAIWHGKPFTGSRFIGFNIRRFDLRMLIQRSRYLGLDTPPISLARYGKGDVVDLFDVLTFDEPMDGTTIVPRTLDVFCQQFGIDVPDTITGADIPALAAAGDWDAIAAHNAADLVKTRRLAERLGVIKAVPVTV